MRHSMHVLFDEFVPASATTWTSAEHNSRLGAFDQLGLHVVMDNVTATTTLNIFVETSGDARNWIQRNSMQAGSTAPSTTGDISFSVAAGGPYQLYWADAGQGKTSNVALVTGAMSPVDITGSPLGPFVRLRLVAGSGGGSHVKIHAVLRGPR